MSDKRQRSPLNRTVYVTTGEIAIACHNETLISTPLGSCVAVAIYDKTTKKGGMAHVMLPGKSRNGDAARPNKYAVDAVERLVKRLQQKGVHPENMEVCLVGGANVLKRPHDTIAREVANSTLDIVQRKNLKVKAASLGGTERRIAVLNTEKGEAHCTVGDSDAMVLWRFSNHKNENEKEPENKMI